ncbi:MAG: hypothetical protein M3R15_23080, partial [Acidobacteriota bacterium]|nr:hypothetical protein [Acidobacteriota bacterium]
MDDFFTRGLSRRSALRIISGAIPAATSLRLISHGASGESSVWNADWDRAVILAATREMDESYDEEAALLKRTIGPEYRYHTNLRNTVAHPTRDSLGYALL